MVSMTRDQHAVAFQLDSDLPTSTFSASLASCSLPSAVVGSRTTEMISSLSRLAAVLEDRVVPYTICPAREKAWATGLPMKPVQISTKLS